MPQPAWWCTVNCFQACRRSGLQPSPLAGAVVGPLPSGTNASSTGFIGVPPSARFWLAISLRRLFKPCLCAGSPGNRLHLCGPDVASDRIVGARWGGVIAASLQPPQCWARLA